MRLIRSVLYPAVACVLSVAAISPAQAQVDSVTKADNAVKLMVNMDQAVRGMEVFKKTCLECHTNSDVTGADFKIKWNTRPVYDLFDVIRTTMPDDKPGTLTPDQYIDVVAYLARLNGAGSGGAPLVATDTAGLKKAVMEIQVPPPMLDSGAVKTDTTVKVTIDTTVTVTIATTVSVTTDSMAKLAVNMDQAVRGLAVFKKTCLECHTTSDVTGADFKIKWNGQPVYDLFNVIRTTMPDDKPGTLTTDEYIDVVAYLVRLNGAANGGAPFVATDTAGLKNARMQIQVPSPMIDSAKVSVRHLGMSAVNSTGPRFGINHLFSRQAAIKH
ncbi:MAG: cytochrome c [Gemmatimonadaceae bacterium]